MAFPLYTFVQKSADQIRQDYLRTISNGLIGLGISQPNVGPGSDYYLQGQGIGNELAVVHANTVITADQIMPDTAAGANLDRWLSLENMSRRPATPSAGTISAPCSVTTPVLVPANAQLTDTNGLRFQAAGGNYTAVNGYLRIPTVAIDTGSATNHKHGDTLQWQTAPPFCGPTATVGIVGGTDGLTGGNDTEVGVDEPPRARLLTALAKPAKGGNAADIALWATQSSPIVQAAWVYPALLGPGTVFYAVAQQAQTVGPFGGTSKNRSIATAIMNGAVLPYVLGLVPATVLCVGASVASTAVDIAILLNLPAAPTASPAGPGGGWLDGSPWPSSISGTTPVTVTAVTSSTVFTVNATTSPTAGVSHVSYVSPSNWQLYTGIVLSVTGSSGAYVVTIDTPWPNLATDLATTGAPVIFPQSVNQQNYVNAALQAFSLMGPGEWTTVSPVLTRAFRHPTPTQAWPNALDARFLKTVVNSGPEVLDANWIYRSAGSGSPTPPTSITLDSNNNLTSAAPGVYVPRNLGLYAA